MNNRSITIDLNGLETSVDDHLRSIPLDTEHLVVNARHSAERFAAFLQGPLPETITSMEVTDITSPLDLSLLQNHPQIKSLSLKIYYGSRKICEGESFDGVVNMLRSLENTFIDTLSLEEFFNCDWDPYDYIGQKIIPANIRRLTMQMCFWGGISAPPPEHFNILIPEGLIHLDLSFTRLGSTRGLSQIAFPEALEYLDIQGNNLNELSLDEIRDFLAVIPKNTTINLKHNGFDNWTGEARETLKKVLLACGKNIEVDERLSQEMRETRNMAFFMGCCDSKSAVFRFFHHPMNDEQLTAQICKYLPFQKKTGRSS